VAGARGRQAEKDGDPSAGACEPSGRVHLGIGPTLTEIYLWHACSCHEIEDGNTRAGSAGQSIGLINDVPTVGELVQVGRFPALGLCLVRASDWALRAPQTAPPAASRYE
jgi:hypothetical protein